jgi:trehalose-6-phosphate synthase
MNACMDVGVYIEPSAERDALTVALGREGYIPVYLDQKTVDLHYNGFCNSVLWQLFHYVPLNIGVCVCGVANVNGWVGGWVGGQGIG